MSSLSHVPNLEASLSHQPRSLLCRWLSHAGPAGLRNLFLLPLLSLPGSVATNSIVVSCVLRRGHTWEEGTALLHLSLCRGVPGRAARGPPGGAVWLSGAWRVARAARAGCEPGRTLSVLWKKEHDIGVFLRSLKHFKLFAIFLF